MRTYQKHYLRKHLTLQSIHTKTCLCTHTHTPAHRKISLRSKTRIENLEYSSSNISQSAVISLSALNQLNIRKVGTWEPLHE